MQFEDIRRLTLPATISPVEMMGLFVEGIKLALSKECRLFIIIPILINTIVLITGAYAAYTGINSLLSVYLDALPEFLSFLSAVIAIVLWLSLGFAFVYFFTAAATIIASPFYGLLAEKVELITSGTAGSDDGIVDLVKDLPRIFLREVKKQLFYLPRALLCLILFLIPFINILAAPAFILLSGYMAAVQYSDYAFDNHKVPFNTMRKTLGNSLLSTFIFGIAVSFLITVPVLNLLIPPCAVCTGTLYYARLRQISSDPNLTNSW